MTRNLGVGVGMRDRHYPVFLTGAHAPARWIEVNAEKYLPQPSGTFDAALQVLELVRPSMPVVLHGTSMSLGTVDGDNRRYLSQLRELIHIIEPALVSDHLCWSGTNGTSLFDLLPLPLTSESIDVVVARISRAQDTLQRQILVENLSTYLELAGAEMTEWEFISEVLTRADCLLLLDINNVYVSCRNHGWDAHAFLAGIPHHRVRQIHLAGHHDAGGVLVDTHGERTAEAVWALYAWYVARYGAVSSMIEWDNDVPSWAVLSGELARLEAAMNLRGEEQHRCG